MSRASRVARDAAGIKLGRAISWPALWAYYESLLVCSVAVLHAKVPSHVRLTANGSLLSASWDMEPLCEPSMDVQGTRRSDDMGEVPKSTLF